MCRSKEITVQLQSKEVKKGIVVAEGWLRNNVLRGTEGNAIHCYPGLLKVESCSIKISTRKLQFNPKAFTFTALACSFTTCV